MTDLSPFWCDAVIYRSVVKLDWCTTVSIKTENGDSSRNMSAPDSCSCLLRRDKESFLMCVYCVNWLKYCTVARSFYKELFESNNLYSYSMYKHRHTLSKLPMFVMYLMFKPTNRFEFATTNASICLNQNKFKPVQRRINFQSTKQIIKDLYSVKYIKSVKIRCAGSAPVIFLWCVFIQTVPDSNSTLKSGFSVYL